MNKDRKPNEKPNFPIKTYGFRSLGTARFVRSTLGAGDDTAYWDFQHRKVSWVMGVPPVIVHLKRIVH